MSSYHVCPCCSSKRALPAKTMTCPLKQKWCVRAVMTVWSYARHSPQQHAALTVAHTMQRRKGRSKLDGSGPRVVAPQVDQAYGKSEQPPASQFETTVLQFLAVFFAAIMVEGVFLAVSVRMITAC